MECIIYDSWYCSSVRIHANIKSTVVIKQLIDESLKMKFYNRSVNKQLTTKVIELECGLY